jgi:hypothetical protein
VYRRKSSAPRPRFVPYLEVIEDRNLPSVSAFFDAPSSILALRGDAGDNTVRETLSAGGFLELALDGQRHSSDPTSAYFDKALAGARAGTLAGLWFDGGGHDTLTLGSQRLAGGLQVNAPGVTVVIETVSAIGPVAITAQAVTVTGTLAGSRLDVTADRFVNTGQLRAAGALGGQVLVHAGKVLNAGGLMADGEGSLRVDFTDSYIDTTAAVSSASGGRVTVDGGSTGRLFSSGTFRATGEMGGSIDLFGREVVLNGATVDASGEGGGGSVRIGGDFQGRNTAVANAQSVTVTGATTLRADALRQGDGGRVIIWADQGTGFAGSVSARGGAGGQGGFIEVSAKGQLSYSGNADAGAVHGQAGTLLLDPKNLVISAAQAGMLPQFDLIDPHPTAGGGFGTRIQILTSGNVVVTNPIDDFGGTNAGAVYLFNGLTGALISSLVGSAANDGVGSSAITSLTNGNYVVQSPNWNGVRGAVTWGSGSTGISGVIAEGNSLVGSNPGDLNPSNILVLSNGNYVVASRFWNGRRGAATWGSGTTGVHGTVSEATSLVGSDPWDLVGINLARLSNDNYVVGSSSWNGNRGEVTWGDGSTGVRGTVSEANSLVGSNPGDQVGFNLTSLTNGNYVVGSRNWNSNRGAVTWVNGTTGQTLDASGTISEVNSLVGTNPGDQVGFTFTTLSNGNYVVGSRNWNGSRGAATWVSGSTGLRGTVSEANSLVGSNPGDQVGFSLTILSNGNYVVGSPN